MREHELNKENEMREHELNEQNEMREHESNEENEMREHELNEENEMREHELNCLSSAGQNLIPVGEGASLRELTTAISQALKINEVDLYHHPKHTSPYLITSLHFLLSHIHSFFPSMLHNPNPSLSQGLYALS
eukprot:GHVN01102727.1.p1 GENE.GHVN01102727.1~~GHVN01102727.1.p1  ORF type:complete len:133 (+),score=37.08 GHVN01102727.1:27-425(+)